MAKQTNKPILKYKPAITLNEFVQNALAGLLLAIALELAPPMLWVIPLVAGLVGGIGDVKAFARNSKALSELLPSKEQAQEVEDHKDGA